MARLPSSPTKVDRRPNRWKSVLVALLLVMGTIAATIFLTSYLLTGTTPLELLRATAAPVSTPPRYDLGQFTVNLSGSGRSSFMRTNIIIEVNDRRVLNEVSDREIQLRDRVVSVIRSYDPGHLALASGYESLRQDLLAAMDSEMLRGRITRVYFTEFVIQ